MGNLPALIELYARGLPLEEPYVKILSWYFSLTVKQINKYFRALKDKLKIFKTKRASKVFLKETPKKVLTLNLCFCWLGR